MYDRLKLFPGLLSAPARSPLNKSRLAVNLPSEYASKSIFNDWSICLVFVLCFEALVFYITKQDNDFDNQMSNFMLRTAEVSE